MSVTITSYTSPSPFTLFAQPQMQTREDFYQNQIPWADLFFSVSSSVKKSSIRFREFGAMQLKKFNAAKVAQKSQVPEAEAESEGEKDSVSSDIDSEKENDENDPEACFRPVRSRGSRGLGLKRCRSI